MTRRPLLTDLFFVQHQHPLFTTRHLVHIWHAHSWPGARRSHYISRLKKERLIMFFFFLKAEMGEIDLQHNRRVKSNVWGLFDVMCSRRQSLIHPPFPPSANLLSQDIYVRAENQLYGAATVFPLHKCCTTLDFLLSGISNALKCFVLNYIQLSPLCGMIHLCLRFIKLESHSDVKSRARAAPFVVLPSARSKTTR